MFEFDHFGRMHLFNTKIKFMLVNFWNNPVKVPMHCHMFNWKYNHLSCCLLCLMGKTVCETRFSPSTMTGKPPPAKKDKKNIVEKLDVICHF